MFIVEDSQGILISLSDAIESNQKFDRLLYRFRFVVEITLNFINN